MDMQKCVTLPLTLIHANVFLTRTPKEKRYSLIYLFIILRFHWEWEMYCSSTFAVWQMSPSVQWQAFPKGQPISGIFLQEMRVLQPCRLLHLWCQIGSFPKWPWQRGWWCLSELPASHHWSSVRYLSRAVLQTHWKKPVCGRRLPTLWLLSSWYRWYITGLCQGNFPQWDSLIMSLLQGLKSARHQITEPNYINPNQEVSPYFT